MNAKNFNAKKLNRSELRSINGGIMESIEKCCRNNVWVCPVFNPSASCRKTNNPV